MQVIQAIHRYMLAGRTWYQRDPKLIQYLTVHHTASFGTKKVNGQDVDKTYEEILQEIMDDHTKQGWPGASYHEVIMPDGTVYILNAESDITWHDTHNIDSYAICLVGYFHTPYNQQPTKEQLISLRNRLDELTTKHSEFPADQSNVLGHRDRFATACPGDTLYPYVLDYRTKKGLVDWGVVAPVNPIIPTSAAVPPSVAGTYTVEQYEALKVERDAAIATAKLATDDLTKIKNNYTTFTASSYNTVDDVNKVIKVKDEEIESLNAKVTKLMEEQSAILKSSGTLASEVQKSSTIGSTAIDEGLAAKEENKELQQELSSIFSYLKIKDPNATAYHVIKAFEDIKTASNQRVKVERNQILKEAQTLITDRTEQVTKSGESAIKKFMSLFGFTAAVIIVIGSMLAFFDALGLSHLVMAAGL